MGPSEATEAGKLLAEAGHVFDEIHISVLQRTRQTAEKVLQAMGTPNVPMYETWHLNERHYGALQGLNKKEIFSTWGEQESRKWWRGYHEAPPPVGLDDPRHPRFDPLYSALPPEDLPASESLAGCQRRTLPYWRQVLEPKLRAGRRLLIVSHGNTLRGLVMHLEHLSAEEMERVEIPSGVPLVYCLSGELGVVGTLAIAGFYKDWGAQGEGLGNFLTFGDFPSKSIWDADSLMIPRGVILNRDLSTIHPVDLYAEGEIQEFVSHSRYKYSVDDDKGLHPFKGETELNYTGPKPPYEHLDVDAKYSWMKSPRWKGKAMEVGPLARVLMLYAKGHEPTKELVGMTLNKLDVPVQALFSTLGRTAARTLESKIIADAMQGWYDQLIANIKAGDVRTFNEKNGSLPLGRSPPRARVSWKRRVAAWRTTSSSRTKKSPIIKPWCRPPGTPARATRWVRTAHTKPRSRDMCCMTRNSPSKFCAPSTALTPALPAPCMSPTRMAKN